jgi:hypothetical protein
LFFHAPRARDAAEFPQRRRPRSIRLYNDAAPEWRADATLEDSKATLERIREKLGRPGVRNQQTAREEQTGTGHTVIVIYQTSFERGAGMETFTLVDRGGTWQLAKYFVSSTVLK